ncbi:hypothetical protein MMB92_04885 [Burkholderia sp. IO2]|nr:hypothetical protein [Burkholderia sp. IO2]MDG0063282.1 hypothetical protein [Burkholderia sp. IO2]
MEDFKSTPQAPNVFLALNTLGWKAFQDLCAQVCEVAFNRTVSVYREAQDGGQDAVFMLPARDGRDQSTEATVQCKFSSRADGRLRPSDISDELDTVRNLVSAGKASVYYFITNLGIDAPVASEIRDALTEAGVLEPHVLGREWLTLQIKSSSRLRALVPRVYGLGDLSTIVDERCAAQTEALLGHLLPSLKVYVPTGAHRTAVRALGEHKFVLLLGSPAAGKSMLAAILATTAIDSEHHQTFKCEGPLELRSRWNPHERNRLFWIDDAFGPNQLRDDYVDAWIEFMPKMKAAIELGNHFILTSRTHIWNAAKHKLGTRNHPLLADGRAVVDVGWLSPEERQQILYNHIKAGIQTKTWKQAVKPHLQSLAEQPYLLPEIARRLGDSSYTTGVKSLPDDLFRFVHEPQEFLKETILELTAAQQAAMTSVFLARSVLPDHSAGDSECKVAADKFGVPVASVIEALGQLQGVFLLKRLESGQMCWGFVHPTFADAISSILSVRSDLVGLYVRGTRLENLLSEAVCEGAPGVRDAVVVPATSFDNLIGRLADAPDAAGLNEKLFLFLVGRCPESVANKVLELDPSILRRRGDERSWHKVEWNNRIRLHGLAHRLGVLEDSVRLATSDELQEAALRNLDLSFLQDDDLLRLIPPLELMRLTGKLLGLLDENIGDRISNLADSADPDSDLDDHFDPVSSFLRDIEDLIPDDLQSRIQELQDELADAKRSVKSTESEDSSASFWEKVAPAKVRDVTAGRSIFSDVDD